jgi:hypothetical protein
MWWCNVLYCSVDIYNYVAFLRDSFKVSGFLVSRFLETQKPQKTTGNRKLKCRITDALRSKNLQAKLGTLFRRELVYAVGFWNSAGIGFRMDLSVPGGYQVRIVFLFYSACSFRRQVLDKCTTAGQPQINRRPPTEEMKWRLISELAFWGFGLSWQIGIRRDRPATTKYFGTSSE